MKLSEFSDKIIGFMIYKLHKTKLEILKFSVDHKYRNCSVGKQMIEKLIEKLSNDKNVKVRNIIFFEVRESNLKFQTFLRKMGFKAIKVLRKFFDDSGEDAYVMQYSSS